MFFFVCFYSNCCDLEIWPESSSIPRSELLKHVKGKHALFISLDDKIDQEIIDAAGNISKTELIILSVFRIKILNNSTCFCLKRERFKSCVDTVSWS